MFVGIAGLTLGLVVAAPAGPDLTVDAAAGHHRISPDVYGVNGATDELARAIDLPVERWGGNLAETYNWKVRGSNHGLDWYFENFPDCWEERFDYCASGRDYSAADAVIERGRRTGADTLLTLPLLGWVARSVSYDGVQPCSYPASTFDPQDDHDPYNPACGNGRRNGGWITSPAVDPNVAGRPAGPSWGEEWVEDLVDRYGTAAEGGVRIYALGNEPGLWHEGQRDFHPAPLSFDELWSKSRDLATVVKATDPTAEVLGPAEWGWPNYFCSSADVPDNGCTPESPDRAAHGGLDLSSWYLQQFAEREEQTGVRLLDYFDLHYYPQTTYRPATDATRSLWDPTFRDPSWIDEKIHLIPRMRAWVDDNYPGTKIALSEYNLGLDVTGSLRLQNVIQADTLGIFGREGVDLATFWPEERAPVPAAAFRMFRNYDGRHHGYGDRGVRASSAAERRLSVFAARRGATGPLTVVVVNKTAASLRSGLTLSGFPHRRTAAVYRYAGGPVAKAGSVAVGKTGFTTTYPARSITLVEVQPR